MIDHLNWPATIVFVAFFAAVTILGFAASRWKSGDLATLHEWGLGGRRFGTWITWFLLGGDLYTAYTVIAVPAIVYANGASGFFAVPYTIIVYPFIFLTMPRLWSVAHRRGFVTTADFVLARYGNPWLELAVAFTGVLATMPYIALQLVGMEKVIQALGFQAEAGTPLSHAPLTAAFVILALYTYRSGLRAPAMIAFVKDIMIYIFVIAAIVIIPARLGGYSVIFDAAHKAYEAKGGATGLTLKPTQIWPYITLALGSAMALFMYPHSITGVLSASSSMAIKRNAMLLPAYSLVLGFIALMGFMGHAAGIKVTNAQDVVPQLFLKVFADANWFVGFVFAAIAIGALVPAAVMSIGAANTFTRNFWRPFIAPEMSGAAEARLAKLVSLIVKVGALAVILFVPTKFAIDFQLLGGVWMIQIFPAVVFGLYTRWLNGRALLVGWAAGMILGTWLSAGPSGVVVVQPVFSLFAAYNGLVAVALNMAVSMLLSLLWSNTARDSTRSQDYLGGTSIHA